jgi:hypothetical protein
LNPYVSGSGLRTGHGSNGPSRIGILTILNAELQANSSCGNIGSDSGLGLGCALSENSVRDDSAMLNVIARGPKSSRPLRYLTESVNYHKETIIIIIIIIWKNIND